MMNTDKKYFFLPVLFLIAGIFSASAANVTLEIPPGIYRGQMFDINVVIDPKGEHLAGAQLDLEFDKSKILLNSIREGNFLKQSGIDTFFNNGTIDNQNGKVINIYGSLLGKGNVTTPGIFIIINATSIESINNADINFKNFLAVDPNRVEQINPISSPKPTVKTEAVSSASGDAQGGGGTGGATGESTVEALPEQESSNKTIFIAAFAGTLIISILVYKYVIPKYSASKGLVSDIRKQKNVVQEIGKGEKIVETTRKKLSSVIRAEASNGNIKNIASDTKKSESRIKKARAPGSKDHGPIPNKKNGRKKKGTEKKTGKPAA
jgi:hypothetical protein